MALEGMKGRLIFDVLCDKNMSPKHEVNFHIVVRLTILYGVECWLVKKFIQKMKIAEMRMLRWKCGHSRRDKIRNENIHCKVGVVIIVEKM